MKTRLPSLQNEKPSQPAEASKGPLPNPLCQDVLVPVFQDLPGFMEFYQQFQPVMDHWKFPYKFVPVLGLPQNLKPSNESQARQSFPAGGERRGTEMPLDDGAVLFIFQPGSGKNLGPESLRQIASALQKGAGLFIADPSFLSNPHLKEFPFAADFPAITGTFESREFRVSRAGNFTTATKTNGGKTDIHVPLKIAKANLEESKWHVTVRSFVPSRRPLPVFAFSKPSRIGISLIDPAPLIRDAGFGTSLDVFYWRSLVSLARKPFFQFLPPRFLTFRIEDCIGEGGFDYAKILLDHGYRLHLGLDLNDFDFEKSQKLKPYYRKRQIEFSPHAFTHYKGTRTEETDLIYVDFSGKDYPPTRLSKNFIRLKSFEKKSGFRFSPVLTYHYCQLGARALPHLQKMGVKYLTFPFLTNVKLDQALTKKWACRPFGKLGLVADRFPEDPHFFVIASLPFPPEKLSKMNMVNVDVTSQLDFLFGLNLKVPGRDFGQYEEAVARVGAYLQWAYENLFFGNIFTHETLINYLRFSEFKNLVVKITARVEKFQPEHALYQDIARYYEARSRARFVNSFLVNGSGISTILGQPGENLHVAIYTEKNGRIETEVRKIQTTGKTQEIAAAEK